MHIDVWGNNKPEIQRFDSNGKYRSYKTASYSSHSIHKTVESTILEM